MSGMKRIIVIGALSALAGLFYLRLTKQKKQKKVFIIGTRKSDLAMWQALHVQKLLRERYPDLDVRVEGISTIGDKDTTNPLSTFSDKGVFTKELDTALLQGAIDAAVHCMKDLPTVLPSGIVAGAVLERGNTEDCVVLHPKHRGLTLETLPAESVLGTSALRRTAILAKHYPHLTCKNIRGNVNTRLAKLDRGEYDAIILARIGLERLGMHERIAQVLDSSTFGNAVGQGALAVCCRTNDFESRRLLSSFHHLPTLLSCHAERGMLQTLEGGCKVPIAVHTQVVPVSGQLRVQLHAWVVSGDGKICVDETHAVEVREQLDPLAATSDVLLGSELEALRAGQTLGNKLREKGAERILQSIRSEKPYSK